MTPAIGEVALPATWVQRPARAFFGPLIDWTVFVATIAVLPLFAFSIHFGVPEIIATVVYYYVLLFPHFLGSYEEAYTGSAWRSRPLLYIAVPLLLVVGTCWGLATGQMVALQRIRFYWAVLHVAQQFVWILAAERRRSGTDHPWRSWVDMGAFGVGQLAVFQFLLRGVPSRDFVLQPIRLPPAAELGLGAIGVLAALVGLGWIAWDLRRGCASRFAVSMWISYLAGLVFVGSFFSTQQATLTQGFYLGLVGWHNAQYIAWVAFARDPGVGSAAGGVKVRFVLKHWLWRIGVCVPLLFILTRTHTLRPATFVFAFVHFYLDGFLWKAPDRRQRIDRLA